MPNPAPMSAAPPAGAAGQANDDPTQPMGADPLMDAGGFDPAPQGEGEVNHSVPSGDTATVGSAHS